MKCGHPTLQKLVARSEAAFNSRVIGVIGGLHLTDVPESVVQGVIDLVRDLKSQLVGLSPHDSDPDNIERFREAFPAAYQDVMIGRPIRLAGRDVVND